MLYWIVGEIIKGYSPLILGQLYRIVRDSKSVSGHIYRIVRDSNSVSGQL